MDSLITAAAYALAAGDPLGALNRVALRDDAPALALRGIAMAQLGDLPRAKQLLRKAARVFGPQAAAARARCIVAEAEVAIASRDLGWPAKRLDAARTTLEAHGDGINAAHARVLEARRLLLIGRPDAAEVALDGIDPVPCPPASIAVRELVRAGIALRRLRTNPARTALERAGHAAHRAGIPALMSEVEQASRILDTPAVRLVVDACRHLVKDTHVAVSLASRPVLFALAHTLAEAWPEDVSRDTLITHAFRTRHVNETHRVRLRVEVGRLRKLLRPLAGLHATARGFALSPRRAPEVALLTRLVEEPHAAVLALLADGEAWSSSALALALGTSQRSVQRALESLASAGKVQSFGQGRARRWITPPVPGFATILLLPPLLPSG
ncbi:MAG: helix-turn-helix domain-containing protein [Candidatus Thiodiazotropha sp.]